MIEKSHLDLGPKHLYLSCLAQIMKLYFVMYTGPYKVLTPSSNPFGLFAFLSWIPFLFSEIAVTT